MKFFAAWYAGFVLFEAAAVLSLSLSLSESGKVVDDRKDILTRTFARSKESLFHEDQDLDETLDWKEAGRKLENPLPPLVETSSSISKSKSPKSSRAPKSCKTKAPKSGSSKAPKSTLSKSPKSKSPKNSSSEDTACLEKPSPAPSQAPSESNRPSQSPSESVQPSQTPSESIQPSQVPSESLRPSQSPSQSVEPSQSPSESVQPSLSPSQSVQPSQAPSQSEAPSTSNFNVTLSLLETPGNCSRASDVGCSNADGTSGNPNDLANCFDIATVGRRSPFFVDSVTIWVGGFLPSTNLLIRLWNGTTTSGPISDEIVYEQNLTSASNIVAGKNEIALDQSVQVFTNQICIGVSALDPDDSLRLQVAEGSGTQSYVRFPRCARPNFVSLRGGNGLLRDFCIEANAFN